MTDEEKFTECNQTELEALVEKLKLESNELKNKLENTESKLMDDNKLSWEAMKLATENKKLKSDLDAALKEKNTPIKLDSVQESLNTDSKLTYCENISIEIVAENLDLKSRLVALKSKCPDLGTQNNQDKSDILNQFLIPITTSPCQPGDISCNGQITGIDTPKGCSEYASYNYSCVFREECNLFSIRGMLIQGVK